MDLFRLLIFFPLVSAEEARKIREVHIATARRNFNTLRMKGWATYHEVGRGGHREYRWCLTERGVHHFFPGGDAPWWLCREGIEILLERVEMLRACYGRLPELLWGWGRWWFEGDRAPELLRVEFLRPNRQGFGAIESDLRQSGLIQFTVELQGGTHLLWCWVGKELRAPLLKHKWQARFAGLWTNSAERESERRRNWLIDQRDPDYDPTPRVSGIVFVGADDWALELVVNELPLDELNRQPVALTNAEGTERYMFGKVRPAPLDRVGNWPVDTSVGRPQKVVNPLDGPHAEDFLGDVLPARILDLVEEWSGLRVRDIARLTHVGSGQVRPVVQHMFEGDWLVERGDMLYLGERGIKSGARRDRIRPSTVRTRVAAALQEDHKAVGRHKWHTIAVNETMIRLAEAGYAPVPGWRAVKDLAGRTQLKPDLVFYAIGPFGAGHYCVEVERTAKHPEQVDDKLHPYEVAHSLGMLSLLLKGVIFITEKPEQEALFQDLGKNLPLLTATLPEVKRGRLWSMETVWKVGGKRVSMTGGRPES